MSLRHLPRLLLCITLQAFARSESAAPTEGVIDCEHPPKNMARVLPKKMAGTANIICTPSAQIIVAQEGWVWRFPGSFFDRPSIPAYSPIESRPIAGGRYFVGFSANELSAVEVKKLHERFTKALATYSGTGPPQRIVKLAARNDQGHSVDAYFGFTSGDEGWVALCAPDCAPEMFFLTNRQ